MSNLDDAAVAALLARARRDVDDGVLPAVQLALGYQGELVAYETYGAPAGSRFVTFSVTKAFSGGLAWLLMSDGGLTASTRVADVVPEFASNGKQDVTIEHLLTHTAGFPRAPMRPEEGADPEQRRKRLASWRLDWEPGTRTEYHATSAYWALVAVIDELTGSDFRQVFAERIAAPLGIPGLTFGAPVGAQDGIVTIRSVGSVADGAETFGDRVTETGEGFLLRFNEPEVLASGVPGAGAVGTAADVATYYQALLHNPHGLWDAAVLADATGNVRNTLVDPLFNCPANRTLGLVVAGDDDKGAVRGFGRYTSARAFGALGVGGQIAWADPDTGLSFSYLTSGLDVDIVASFTRSAKIAGLAARCAS
ncbi:MAG TPA: serine hydrolase domain-containing protein [Mycobacteriales bacterium]|nr:serine hydrolase domain-containing protein [Mycobacteriales bacterium]